MALLGLREPWCEIGHASELKLRAKLRRARGKLCRRGLRTGQNPCIYEGFGLAGAKLRARVLCDTQLTQLHGFISLYV